MAFNNPNEWYESFIERTMKPLIDGKTETVNLGPLSLIREYRHEYVFFSLSELKDQKESNLMLPRFVMENLTRTDSNVKELLSSLRKESLELIIQYQFGFKSIMGQN